MINMQSQRQIRLNIISVWTADVLLFTSFKGRLNKELSGQRMLPFVELLIDRLVC